MSVNTQHWPKHPTKTGWLLKNNGGYNVRIVCVDIDGPYPILDSKGTQYRANGFYYDAGSSDHKLNLIIPQPWVLGKSVNGHTLRKGQKWHRDDWTQDMLPAGWRPHILGEQDEIGDEAILEDGEIFTYIKKETYIGTSENDLHRRTRRPLPEVKPVVNYVPLDSEDILPGSVFRYLNTYEYRTVVYADHSSVTLYTPSGEFESFPFETLQKYMEINRSIPLTGKWDKNAWELCKKLKTNK